MVEKLDKEDDFLIAMEACGGAHHVARTLIEKVWMANFWSSK